MESKIEGEELTKKREEFTTEIRKTNREDFFKKKRTIFDATLPLNNNSNDDMKEYIKTCLERQYTINEFPFLIENINSKILKNEYLGVIGIRKILSIEISPPIQSVIDANLVPKLLEFMERSEHPSLQLESTWALTNIATGNSFQIQSIVDRGGLTALIKLLESPLLDLVDQAIWALGNIAGDSIAFRDLIIKDAANLLIQKSLTSNSYNIFKNSAWALSNLCRGKPRPNYDILKNSVPVFARVLRDYKSEENDDLEILIDALWALSYLSTGNESIISSIISQGCISELMKIFDKFPSNLSIILPCLRTLGNIITGTEEQTKAVVSYGGIERFFSLLSHEKKTLRKEACWALSNVTAENPANISLIFNNPDFIKKLLTIVAIDSDDVKKEAAWVICNCTKFGSHPDICKLVECGGLEMFESLLDSTETKTLVIAIEGITNILLCGKKYFSSEGPNPFLLHLEKTKATTKLDHLQMHPNDEVYDKVYYLLENFFEVAETL